jgi:hypothetical protein
MSPNIFKDAFTGRILHSIKNHIDEDGIDCIELIFTGTVKKLRLYGATRPNEHGVMSAKIRVDDSDINSYQSHSKI